jgi:hypothetical protein
MVIGAGEKKESGHSYIYLNKDENPSTKSTKACQSKCKHTKGKRKP